MVVDSDCYISILHLNNNVTWYFNKSKYSLAAMSGFLMAYCFLLFKNLPFTSCILQGPFQGLYNPSCKLQEAFEEPYFSCCNLQGDFKASYFSCCRLQQAFEVPWICCCKLQGSITKSARVLQQCLSGNGSVFL